MRDFIEVTKLKASIVICTLNNLKGLKVCIKSIEKQDYNPCEIIIVHAGDFVYTENYIKKLNSVSSLNYIFISSIKSLIVQRNIGIENSIGDVVFFIDDDAVLELGYLKNIIKVYNKYWNNNLGGVQGTIYQRKMQKSTIYSYFRKIFLASDTNGKGTLQRSGYPSYLKYNPEPQYVEVFSGCMMSFRRDVLNNNKFNQRFEKYWWGDDFEISYRISKNHKLIQIPDAIIRHENSTPNYVGMRKIWTMSVVNRKYIFDEYLSNKKINYIFYYWSIIGDILIVILQSLKLGSIDPFIGLLKGLMLSKKAILPQANQMKIFGIGLSRTGTMSLHHALIILGYRSHFVFDGEEDISMELSKKFDAFTHTPLASVYKELDQRFPNSKFILTVRKDRENWLNSCEQQGKLVVKKSAALKKVLQRTYGTETFDLEKYSSAYDQHLKDVIQYFAHRENDLLILDICGGEGFEKLCPFLGKSITMQPFPQKNSISSLRRPSQLLKRFLIKRLKAREIKRFLMKSFSY